MILVEVVELVVHVDGRGNVRVESDGHCAGLIFIQLTVVILSSDTLNALAHHVQRDTKSEENQTEDTENDHGGAEGGNGSPRWKHLLLEFALLQLLDFFLCSKAIGQIQEQKAMKISQDCKNKWF